MTTIGAARDRWTGIARTAWTLAQHLALRPGLDLRFSAVGSLGGEALARAHLHEAGLGDRIVAPAPTALQRTLLVRAGGTGMPAQAATAALRALNRLRRPIDPTALPGLDMFFSFFAGIPAQLRGPRGPRCGIYVHDLIPLLRPHFCTDHQRGVLRRILGSIRPEDLVVVNSACTRADFCAHTGRDPATVPVVPLAADRTLFHPVAADPARDAVLCRRYGLPDGPYTLTLHSAAPHKNMGLLVRAHAAYRARRGAQALPLVIAGGRGNPRAELRAAGDLDEADLAGVIFAGYVADADLAWLYSRSRAFFFPSHYEGFGLPVLEALSCGVPVFASDRASLPELFAPLPAQHRGPGRLLPPDAVAPWVQAFHDAETAEPLDADVLAALETAFSWERSAAALETALCKGGRP
jgi:glycosyltransferase involved in cell wall biosynthesis